MVACSCVDVSGDEDRLEEGDDCDEEEEEIVGFDDDDIDVSDADVAISD